MPLFRLFVGGIWIVRMDKPMNADRANMYNAILFTSIHALAVSAIWHFNWASVVVAVVLLWLSVGWGIGIGYHRLLTHRSFRAHRWFEYVLAVLGSLSLQGGVISWVTTHRIHHAFAERDGDPHSPTDGFLWSHTGWMLFGVGQDYRPEVCQKYSPDLLEESFYQSFERINIVPAIVLGILLLHLGGWGMVAWGIGVRTVASWHLTWAVNSIAHTFGTQPFSTNENSRNNPILGVLAFGEGWHNNHHAFPTSARHGLTWLELDLSYMQIKIFEKLGLVSDVKTPTWENIEKKRLRPGSL